jgi:hypothetical protein
MITTLVEPKMSLDNLIENKLSISQPLRTGINTSVTTKTLYDEFMSIIATFSERKRLIVLRRLGFNGTCESLENIGQTLQVTRERVRQIEAICLEIIKQNCGSKLVEKLQKCLINRPEPLYLDSLALEDEWFEGFSERPIFLAQIIEKLTLGNYSVFTVKDRLVVAQINAEQWLELKTEILNYLKSQIANKLSQDKVTQFIRRQAKSYGAPELASLLQESLQDKLHFACVKGKGPKILCSIGRGLTHVLTTLLVEAKEPLHYTEIAHRCSARLGRQVEAYVHNTLKNLAYLYGRGVYGTLDHFPLNNKDKKTILAAAENIILEGATNRQWTCSELINLLKPRVPVLPKKLDKYVVNILLSESTLLKSVGRLVWIKKTRSNHHKVSRVDLQQACTEIVAKSKSPISTHEIKRLIVKQRGVDEYFTIFPSHKIARIKPNIWGLVERDFLVTSEQRRHILDTLYEVLEQRQEGLHITEIKISLQMKGVTMPSDFTNYMAMSLTQTDSRFKVRRGQIVGLAQWPDGKRVTVKEAVERLAQNFTSPMSMLELRHAVERIVQHEVKQPLHRLLENADIVYDERSNLWNLRH